METEYIEKQAAVTIPVLPKEHRTYQTMNLDDAYENGWCDALECVEKIPPADVRPVVMAHWEEYEFMGERAYRCSNCKCMAPASWFLDGSYDLGSRFCNSCGADVRDIEDKEPVDKFEGWSDELKQTYRELLEKLNLIEIAFQRRFTIQQCCDMMLIAANAAFGFGPVRLSKLQETYQDVFREYAELAESESRDDPDIEYTRAKVDGKLQQILGDRFTPWEERYLWTT